MNLKIVFALFAVLVLLFGCVDTGEQQVEEVEVEEPEEVVTEPEPEPVEEVGGEMPPPFPDE